MRLVADLIYVLLLLLTLPVWLVRLLVTGKIRTDWPARFGRAAALPPHDAPTVLLHAVSVGEVNALRHLVPILRAHPDRPRVVIACTTDTGLARARELFGVEHAIVRFPLDFSFAVRRFLRAINPAVVALVELEVWPTFVALCTRRGIPVCVINGRLSERSIGRYRRIRWLLRSTFARLAAVAAQNESYAARFVEMGVPADRVRVTDTMKWDAATIADDVPGAAALAESMGIDRSRPLVVGGSTEPVEHRLLHEATPSGVQLLCAPRRPEWFDDAARDLPGCARRSKGDRGSPTGRFLLDTIGELRQAYALADVVVVGRSFGELHGSDMMEPVALGRATIVGPRVDDFRETVAALLKGGGIIQTDAAGLPGVIRSLLDDPLARAQLAERGRTVVRRRQGASARHAALILSLAKNGPGSSWEIDHHA
ncbi:MAG: hypothetical protein HRU76_13705 [Phycisphaeraceae bacterium]|nr:hypothetical protein [Phycisphaerales bacterium]QOJ18576.1 MAG: hypothetical protein HRU76_13705 [Phycisphaeraceae bacterium]